MPYKIHLFIQGRGWTELNKVYQHTGIVAEYEEALKLATYIITNKIQNHPEPHKYGAKIGDITGIKITETNQKPQKIPKEAEKINWQDHKHKFHKKENTYTLYKTWSWPD